VYQSRRSGHVLLCVTIVVYAAVQEILWIAGEPKACQAGCLLPLQTHLFTFALHTSEQSPNTNALQHRIWQKALRPAQCCSANQADSSLVPRQMPLWTLALHTSEQSANTIDLTKKGNHFLFQMQRNFCQSFKSYFVKIVVLEITRQKVVFSVHCSTGLGRMHSPLCSAALQTRLTAALRHCKYTYRHLLSIQVSSHPPTMHCSTGFGKKHCLLPSAALHTRLAVALCH